MPDPIDYAALATQAGAVAPSPAAAAGPSPTGIDYAALAKQAGAVSSAPAPGPSAGTWEDRGIGGKVWHPAAAGGSERTREDNTLFGMPPEFAALSGLAIGRAVGAPALTAAARALAGLKATVGQALPQVKYEVTKSALEAVGVPRTLSIPVALMVSGIKKPGKAEPPVSDVSPPGVDRYMPNVSGVSTAAPVPAPSGTVTPPASIVTPPAAAAPATEFQAAQAARANTLPDQKALNEAALAARRAAYQASQQGAPAAAAAEPVVAASGKMQLTAPEMTEFTRLRRRGLSLEDALAAVRNMRALNAQIGGATPAEVAQDMAQRRYKS